MEHLLTSSDINRDWLYLLQLGVDVLANWHSLFFLCASITFPIQLLFLLEKLLTKIMENAKMVRFDILKSFRWPQNMHMVHWIYCEIVDLCILVLAKISGASLHFFFFKITWFCPFDFCTDWNFLRGDVQHNPKMMVKAWLAQVGRLVICFSSHWFNGRALDMLRSRLM